MSCRAAGTTCGRMRPDTCRTSRAILWAALALALALIVIAPAAVRADGGTITLAPSPDGVYVAGSSLTASFTTDGALTGNALLSVTFVSTFTQAAIPSTYTVLSAAGTTYTARIAIPGQALGEYTLVIAGQQINGGTLTSIAFTIVAPTPTPPSSPSPSPRLIGTQAHNGPPDTGGVSGGAIAAAVAGGLLLLSLALLIVPPLRRRGNQPPR